jgi:hypothetical protein
MEGGQRRGGDQDAVGAATGFLSQLRRRIRGFRVEDQIGTKALGVFELVVIDIDGTDLHAHGLGVLYRQVPKAAGTGDSDPLTRSVAGFLDALVRRDTGTDDRRRFLGAKTRGDMCDIIRIGEDIVGKATVLSIAAELRLAANRFPR